MANEMQRTWKKSVKGQLQKRVALYFELQLTPKLSNISDDEESPEIIDQVATQKVVETLAHDVYAPLNRMLIQRVESDSSIKFAMAISGQAMELLTTYAPEVMDGLKVLNDTGSVEWMAFPYNNSLSAVVSDDVYREEVTRHSDVLYENFGVRPKTLLAAPFFAPSMTRMALAMGFESILVKNDAWPGTSVMVDAHSDLVVLGTDPAIGDAVVHQFGAGEATLTLEDWTALINRASSDTVVVGIPLDVFETHRESGIGGFIEAFLARAAQQQKLTLPGDVVRSTPHEISGTFESNNFLASSEQWLGSELQRQAFADAIALNDLTAHLVDHHERKLWLQLLSSEHFTNMSAGGSMSNSWLSPHEAFAHYSAALRALGNRAATLPVNENGTAAKAVEAERQHPTTPNWAVQEQSRYKQVTHSHI
jgi:hypothetical protein